MATVTAVVYKNHQKADGTYNVKIRVYHKNEKKFIDTSHFVSQKQLNVKLNIKDKFLTKILEETLNDSIKKGCMIISIKISTLELNNLL